MTSESRERASRPKTQAQAVRVGLAVTALIAVTTSAAIDAPLPATLALLAAAAAVMTWASGILNAAPASPQGPAPERPQDAVPSRPSAEDRSQEALLEAIGLPTLVATPNGVVAVANSRARAYLSPKREIVGRPLEELFTKAEILDLISSARGGVSRGSRVRVPTPDGTTVLDVLAAALPDGVALPEPEPEPESRSRSGTIDGAGRQESGTRHAVLLSLRDVTELSLALQLKTDFVANASHELRTPISAIRAAVDTLSVAGDDAAMRAKLLDMVDRHTTRLDELVRDMLDLSKLESPDAPLRIRDVAASEIARELSEGLATACERRGITLTFDLPGSFERLRTDRRVLMLILKNLVENAVKFADDNTEVRIDGVALPPRVEQGQPDDSPGARFRVIDRGEGIPLQQQQRVFERFFQNDEARSGEPRKRGTGLGLAIVKHGVRALGGSVSVESVWQKGTTMTVDLPSVLPATEAVPQAEPLSTINDAGPALGRSTKKGSDDNTRRPDVTDPTPEKPATALPEG
ncbi:MAG: ATP-binding protein [Planctomycetota bacterium]